MLNLFYKWINWKLLFVAICALSSFAAASGTDIYLFGGAGEPPAKNMFTDDFKSLIGLAHQNDWQMQSVLFDGNNRFEQNKVSQALGASVESFRPGSLQITLDGIQGRLQQNQLKMGDQVLIMIQGHGQSDKEGAAHYVNCEGTNCNLADLKTTVELLEKKGVKVAIVDLSCYSGNSLDLASNKTCVISSTTADDVGWDSFSKSFIKNMNSGQSLEQVFLKARLEGAGRAQISTEAGKSVTQTIEALASEARYNVSDSHYIPRMQGNFCVANSAQILSQQNKQSKEIFDSAAKEISAAQEYRDASLEYQKIYNNLQSLGKKIESYNKNVTNGINWVPLALATPEELRTYPLAAKTRADLEKNNSDFRNLEKLTAQFKEQASYGDYRTYFGYKKGPNPLTDAALRTQDAEKKLYDTLYRGALQQKENPCANFIL